MAVMGRRNFGDALVEDRRLLRPSKAFVYVLADEIGPEDYPGFVIDDFRRRCRRLHARRQAEQRHALSYLHLPSRLWRKSLEIMAELALLNHELQQASRQGSSGLLDGGARVPRCIAVGRSL